MAKLDQRPFRPRRGADHRPRLGRPGLALTREVWERFVLPDGGEIVVRIVEARAGRARIQAFSQQKKEEQKMLLLNRKLGERIVIRTAQGQLIVVSIQRLRGGDGSVAVGVECAAEIVVHREEVYRRICAEQRVASQPQSQPAA